jgi:hypothetical protein
LIVLSPTLTDEEIDVHKYNQEILTLHRFAKTEKALIAGMKQIANKHSYRLCTLKTYSNEIKKMGIFDINNELITIYHE